MFKKYLGLFILFPVVLIIIGIFSIAVIHDTLHQQNREVGDEWLGVEYVTAYRHELVLTVSYHVRKFAPNEEETLNAALKALVRAEEIRNNQKLAQEDFSFYFQKFQESQNEVSDSWQAFMRVAGNHSKLKNDPFFRILLPQYTVTEDWINYSQQVYNDKAEIYNKQKNRYGLLARFLGFKEKPYLKIIDNSRISW